MTDEPTANDNGYDAAVIEVLAGLEPVKRRSSVNLGCSAGQIKEIEAIKAAHECGEITAEEMAERIALLFKDMV